MINLETALTTMNRNKSSFLCGLGIALSAGLSAGLTACSTAPTAPLDKPISAPTSAQPQTVAPPIKAGELPPIIFVHGNGDTAALWQTTMWRFETNGWPSNKLFALDFRLPLARTDDTKPQDGRSGTQDQLNELAAEVTRVLKLTGANKVILVGNSRGGYAIRNYIKNSDGRQTVLAAILGGTPNHGVWRGSFNANSEFNGSSPFLSALNAPQDANGSEITPGIQVLTIRSDNNDKFAQADGRWIGQPTMQTGITYDGPALKGASNIVLPGKDHRETSFHPDSFIATYKFLTGNNPARTTIAPEDKVRLNGKIAGLHLGGRSGELSNLPLAGARVSVFEVQAGTGARIGSALHSKTVAADGLWGPFEGKSNAYYEFVIDADTFATTHIYRSPFLRSSNIVNMRPARINDADKGAVAVVTMSRPRGYFSIGRDRMALDGQSPPPGVAAGVAGVSISKIKVAGQVERTVLTEFNAEKIAVKAWALADNRLVFAEFHD